MKFRPTEDGYVTRLRFYKQSNNAGTHVGNLWTSSGQLLATATYTGETAVRAGRRSRCPTPSRW